MSHAAALPRNGRFILLCFLSFFFIVGAVDAFFVYMALDTNTGLVTENPYEKGLAYNKLLDKAKSQPPVKDEASYENGVFQWKISRGQNDPILHADITIKFIRPVKDGYDFEIKLQEKNNGTYEEKVDFPLPGLWTAKMSATWNNQTYQKSYEFLAR